MKTTLANRINRRGSWRGVAVKCINKNHPHHRKEGPNGWQFTRYVLEPTVEHIGKNRFIPRVDSWLHTSGYVTHYPEFDGLPSEGLECGEAKKIAKQAADDIKKSNKAFHDAGIIKRGF